MSRHDPFAGLLVGSHGRELARSRGMAGLGASGVSSDLAYLHKKYGNYRVNSANEMLEIMQAVGKYLPHDSWQYCTINAWLTGTPSEDDVSFFGKYFTEMPLLEEVCGDHTWFGNQFAAAFKELSYRGAPADLVQWINAKGTAASKVTTTNEQGDANWESAKTDALDALKNAAAPVAFGGAALAVVVVLAFLALRK